LCGVNCFEETLNAILLLKENKCNVIPVFVATKRNIAHFPAILKVCDILGINSVIFNRFIPIFNQYNNNDIGVPSDKDIIYILNHSYLFAQKRKIKIYLGVPINLPLNFASKKDYIIPTSCSVKYPQKNWIIDFAGNIKRCSHSPEIFGNLFQDGIKQLLNEVTQNSSSNEFMSCKFIGNKTFNLQNKNKTQVATKNIVHLADRTKIEDDSNK